MAWPYKQAWRRTGLFPAARRFCHDRSEIDEGQPGEGDFDPSGHFRTDDWRRDGVWLVSPLDGHELALLVGEDAYRSMLDVELRLSTGERLAATFATIDQVETAMAGYERTGEALAGTYFWAKGLVLVRTLDARTVAAVTRELARSGELRSCFELLEEEASPSMRDGPAN